MGEMWECSKGGENEKEKESQKERKKYGMKARCINIIHVTAMARAPTNMPSILW